MKMAFLGLGGVGGYFGAKLARTYAGSTDTEVIFLARKKTAEIISQNGIQLITPGEKFTAHPHRVCSQAKDAGIADFLICSVKSYDLEESLGHFAACIGPQTVILPLQNGIDAPGRIRKMFPHANTWQGCVYIVAHRISPGIVEETADIHKMFFGADASQQSKVQQLHEIFVRAHNDIFTPENIESVVWEKFVFISPLASLTTYFDQSIGNVLADETRVALLRQLIAEIIAVAQACRISLPENIADLTWTKITRLPFEATSSMHRDSQAGGKTEVRSLTGHVIDLAKQHGVSVPGYELVLKGLALLQQ
ncbi:MAG TPA: 2-dehydropantoate 2-reductase [Bacteroidia bacterium]|nr:2-dehydropantoate 2-reductase [Bacteroidia bacterium]